MINICRIYGQFLDVRGYDQVYLPVVKNVNLLFYYYFKKMN